MGTFGIFLWDPWDRKGVMTFDQKDEGWGCNNGYRFYVH